MSTPDVRIEISDDLPPGKYAVPVEADGALIWRIRRGAMSEEAVAEAAVILRYLAEREHWRPRRDGKPATDRAARGSARPLALRVEIRTDLPRDRNLVLLEADGELVWCARPGAMRKEFGEDAALALGYLVRQGAWTQHWSPAGPCQET